MKDRIVLALASLVLLESCGSGEATDAGNDAVPVESNALENASPSDPAQPNGLAEPADEPVPPPDAISHPEGYLPNAGDLPPPPAPEASTDSPPASSDPPPATEDEFIRNRQSGR